NALELLSQGVAGPWRVPVRREDVAGVEVVPGPGAVVAVRGRVRRQVVAFLAPDRLQPGAECRSRAVQLPAVHPPRGEVGDDLADRKRPERLAFQQLAQLPGGRR